MDSVYLDFEFIVVFYCALQGSENYNQSGGVLLFNLGKKSSQY